MQDITRKLIGMKGWTNWRSTMQQKNWKTPGINVESMVLKGYLRREEKILVKGSRGRVKIVNGMKKEMSADYEEEEIYPVNQGEESGHLKKKSLNVEGNLKKENLLNLKNLREEDGANTLEKENNLIHHFQ